MTFKNDAGLEISASQPFPWMMCDPEVGLWIAWGDAGVGPVSFCLMFFPESFIQVWKMF